MELYNDGTFDNEKLYLFLKRSTYLVKSMFKYNS